MRTLLATRHDLPTALTSGFSLAFWVIAVVAAVSVVAALALVRSEEVEAVDAEEVLAG
jgi:hypothetical protein